MVGSVRNDELAKRTRGLRYVVVEGCIGVGKTTLTHLLSRHLTARTVLEIVEENPFLPEFYEDPKAHAFKTQMFFLLSRFKQQQELGQQSLFEASTVSDYLFAKDRIFAELTLSDSELGLYDQVFQALSTKVPVPDLVIYLHAPLDVILQRIQRRGRSFEQNMDPAYLERLCSAYERFFARYTGCPTLLVDTEDLNFPERQEDLQVLLAAAADVRQSGEGRRILTGKTARQTSFA
jgi:deoxyguanosine kinase